MNCRFTIFIVLLQTLLMGLVNAQDTKSADSDGIPKLDWTNVKVYGWNPQIPDDWSRYTDAESQISWSVPTPPKKFRNEARYYSMMYESREGNVAYQVTVCKTQTMHEGTPFLFFDSADEGFFRALKRDKIKFKADPVMHFRCGSMTGRIMGVETEKKSKMMAVVNIATDSAACFLVVVGPADETFKKNIMKLTQSVVIGGDPTDKTESEPTPTSGPGKVPAPSTHPTAAAAPTIAGISRPPRPETPKMSGPKFPPRPIAITQRRAPSRLKQLSWHAQTHGSFPTSNAFGETIRISFKNSYQTPVKLEWIDRTGKRKSYGMIDTGKSKEMNTYGGTIWLISDDSGKPVGYFAIGTKSEIAEVPAETE